MDRDEIEQGVAAHYTLGDVTARILTQLGLQGATPGTVPIEALFPADQLHHGGVALTERMATAAGVVPGQRVLDAGSGIGGAARVLAGRFDCQLDAIDLSAEYVRTAQELDALVGLAGRITHRAGSVVELPYEDGRFDVVWSQNVTMNVADKAAMFAEAFRVLRPGGVYVLSHFGLGDGGPVEYPVPWAMTEETSFPTPPAAFMALLEAAGFQTVTDHARDLPLPPPVSGAEPMDAAAMGDDMPLRRANAGRAVGDGRFVTMLVTARRP